MNYFIVNLRKGKLIGIIHHQTLHTQDYPDIVIINNGSSMKACIDDEMYDELVDNVTQQYPKQLNQFGG